MIANPVMGSFILILTSPFCMTYIAGWLFEGRTVHLIEGQSLSFFPGEVLLAAALTLIICEASWVQPYGWIMWWQSHMPVVALVVSVIVLWLMRKIYDAPTYNMTIGSTGNSATKLAHDVAGYLWCLFVIFTVGLPVVASGLCSGQFGQTISAVAIVALLVLWLCLDAIFDSRQIGHDPVLMHPDDSNTWYRRWLTYLQRRCYAMRTGEMAPNMVAIRMDVMHGGQYGVDQHGNVYKRVATGNKDCLPNDK